MKNLWKLLLLLALSGLTAVSCAAGSNASKTVLIYETIGQAPAYISSFRTYTSSLKYSAASGLSFNLAAAQERGASATSIAQAPVITAVDANGNPLSQSTLLANANTEFSTYAQALADQMVGTPSFPGYLSSVGASSAIFNYQQQVMVQGNTQPMYLAWQEIVDSNGRPRYGNAQLIPSAPNFVYADYTSKSVAAALPASFAYPQAGTVQWQQVNQQIQPLTALQTINVNGAFDAPAAVPNATVYPAGCTLNAVTGLVGCDPDYGLKCLINHVSGLYTATSPNPANLNDTGCPAVPINGYTDFISMENANGASGGYVDYTRSLTPAYTYSTDSNGDTIQTAMVTVSVDTRTMQESGNVYYTPIPAISATDINGNVVTYSGGNFFSDYPYTCVAGNDGGWFPSYGAVAGYSCTSNIQVTLNNIYYTPIPAISATDINGNVVTYSGGNFFSDYPYTCATGYGGNGGQSFPSYGAVAGYSCTLNTLVTTLQNKFTNVGRIGYEVQSTVNRYYVTPDGNYSLIGAVTTNTIAPNQNYNKTVTLPGGANAASYGYIIIDPFNTLQTYDYRNDTVNQLPAAQYLYVAPIGIN